MSRLVAVIETRLKELDIPERDFTMKIRCTKEYLRIVESLSLWHVPTVRRIADFLQTTPAQLQQEVEKC